MNDLEFCSCCRERGHGSYSDMGKQYVRGKPTLLPGELLQFLVLTKPNDFNGDWLIQKQHNLFATLMHGFGASEGMGLWSRQITISNFAAK